MTVATFIWGSTPLMGIFSHLPSGVFVFFRVLFAFPVLVYFAYKKTGLKELFKPPFLPLISSGIALGINWVFFFMAFEYADVSSVVTLYYTGPVISLILAGLFLKEKITLNIIVGIILAFVGVVVSVGGVEFNKGAAVAMLAGISYGVLGFLSKIATNYHRPLIVTTWQVFVSIFITLPFLFLSEYEITLKSLLFAFITGVVHTALALFLWYDALKYIKVSIASILQYLDIVFSIILAYLFLGEIPGLNKIVGAALIIAAGVISIRSKNKGE
ncbi:MAG: DMT family transporter [Epsilonproteobacteria bacterium]|nr:DMT family transporter [Campylobacterota bacterium]